MLTGKKIGELTQLTQITSDTLFPVELSGYTYQAQFSMLTGGTSPFGDISSLATTGSNIFKGNQTITGSVVGAGDAALHIRNLDSYTVIDLEGNYTGYTQLNIRNNGSSTNSSSDIVATADNGTEDTHYINMGINSSNYDGGYDVGYTNDGYLLNAGRNLYIGSLNVTDPNSHVHIFTRNNWKSSSLSVYNDNTIGFNIDKLNGNANTIPSSVSGFTYEFSGSVKLNNELRVDNNITTLKNVILQNVDNVPNHKLSLFTDNHGGIIRGVVNTTNTLDLIGGDNIRIRPFYQSGNTGTVTITGSLIVSSDITTNGQLFVNGVGGNEGGQINLASAPNGTILGGINIDVYDNKLRLWEDGGTNRGGYFDISTLEPSAGTDLRGISLTTLKSIVAAAGSWGDFQIAIAAL